MRNERPRPSKPAPGGKPGDRAIADPAGTLVWEDYEEEVRQAWGALLADPATDEPDVHAFFEKHPCMVPFAEGFELDGDRGVHGAHGSIHGRVYSQPTLPGVRRPRPDFMRILRNSAFVEPVLIEIESPKKRWSRVDGQQPEPYTQAMGQLAQWAAWFNEPENVLQFRRLYELPAFTAGRVFRPRFVLVFGRRSDFETNPEARAGRYVLQADGVTSMTFDRLKPNYHGRDDETVTWRDGELVVITPRRRFSDQAVRLAVPD